MHHLVPANSIIAGTSSFPRGTDLTSHTLTVAGGLRSSQENINQIPTANLLSMAESRYSRPFPNSNFHPVAKTRFTSIGRIVMQEESASGQLNSPRRRPQQEAMKPTPNIRDMTD